MTGDFNAKLDQILANPAMLAQIKALADTMTSNTAKPQETPTEATPEPEPQDSTHTITFPGTFASQPASVPLALSAIWDLVVWPEMMLDAGEAS